MKQKVITKKPRWHESDVENYGVYYDATAPDKDLPRHLATSVRMKMTAVDVMEQGLFQDPHIRVVVPIECHDFPNCHFEVVAMEKPSPRSPRIDVRIKYIAPESNRLSGFAHTVRMNPKARLHIIVNQ